MNYGSWCKHTIIYCDTNLGRRNNTLISMTWEVLYGTPNRKLLTSEMNLIQGFKGGVGMADVWLKYLTESVLNKVVN